MGSFDGVADIYEDTRRSYPRGLCEHLVSAGALQSDSVVVDLGSGTGQLARLLADVADELVAVEPEADMIRVGVRATAHLANVRWVQGSDRDLIEILEDQPIDLVAIGNAFHLLNQPVLMQDVDRLIVDGGALMICSSSVPVWLQEVDWAAALRSVLRLDAGHDGDGVPNHESDADLLAQSAFSAVETWLFERSEQRSADSVVGELVSSASGTIDSALARELRSAIEPFTSTGGNVLEVVRTTALLARRP